MKKKLLIFAHRGEARAFFSRFSLVPEPFLEGLYESRELMLLITGEGPWKAAPKLALVLGQFTQKIGEVINLGIAGALRDEIEVNKIYPIRTCYLEQNNELQFISHTLCRSGLDLITCHTRVLEESLAEHLDNFAPIVDRELWSLAQVCSFTSLSLKAYKLVSDNARETEICRQVKENTDTLSQKLLDYYLALELPEKNSKEKEEFPIWEGLYFTASLKNQRDALFHKLCLKFNPKEVIEKLDLPKLHKLELTPKKKTIHLIGKMRALLNPLQKELQDSLEALSRDMSQAGAQVKFPQNFERAQFHLSAHIEKAEDLTALIKAMEEFDYPQLITLIEGGGLDV